MLSAPPPRPRLVDVDEPWDDDSMSEVMEITPSRATRARHAPARYLTVEDALGYDWHDGWASVRPRHTLSVAP